MSKNLSCAIIGPDFSKLTFGMDESSYDCIALKLELNEKIAMLIAKGVTTFYSTCEYGIPLIAAELVLNLKRYNNISLIAYMPFEEQASRWSNDIRDRWFTLHDNAETVISFTTSFYDGCRLECEEEMIDESDIVLMPYGDKSYSSILDKKNKIYFSGSCLV